MVKMETAFYTIIATFCLGFLILIFQFTPQLHYKVGQTVNAYLDNHEIVEMKIIGFDMGVIEGQVIEGTSVGKKIWVKTNNVNKIKS